MSIFKRFSFQFLSRSKPNTINLKTITQDATRDTTIDHPLSKAPLRAIGIRPMTPTLFFDCDSELIQDNDITVKENFKYLRERIIHWVNSDIIAEIDEEKTPFDKLYAFIQYKERTWFNNNLSHYHWAVYKTKHGLHLVMQMPTWDRVQFALYELKMIFPNSNYFMNCRKLRLRTSPKWNYKTGTIISPEPYMYMSCSCYQELRIGEKELYATYD